MHDRASAAVANPEPRGRGGGAGEAGLSGITLVEACSPAVSKWRRAEVFGRRIRTGTRTAAPVLVGRKADGVGVFRGGQPSHRRPAYTVAKPVLCVNEKPGHGAGPASARRRDPSENEIAPWPEGQGTPIPAGDDPGLRLKGT